MRRLAISRSRPQGRDVIREAEGRWLLAAIAHRSGDLDAAERELAPTLVTLRVHPVFCQLAATTLAAVQLDRGRVAAARELAREIMKATAAHGGAYRAVQVRLVYAESLHAAGEPEEANAILTSARDHLLALAVRITDPEVRRRFLTEVPEHARTLALAAERLRAP